MKCMESKNVCLLIGIIFFLSACSFIPWNKNQNSVLNFLTAEELNTWNLVAKISLTKKNKNITGSLTWRRQKNIDEIQFISPTGIVLGTLIAKDNEFTLETEKRTQKVRKLEELFTEDFPWPVSIESMGFWVRGLSNPNLETQKLAPDKNGRIIEMIQDGWKIVFSGKIVLEQGANRFELPKRITLKKDQLSLRWISTEWQTNQKS